MSGATEHDLDPAAWGPLSSDALTSRYRVHQRMRGHRYSIDDQLTAYAAAHEAPEARRVLDLGTGLGSVALCLAHALPEARIAAIEAQEISFALLTRNVAENGLTDRVHAMHGDLRECRVADDAGFARPFTVDAFRRQCLLEGLDDIGLSLRHADQITAWEAAHGVPAAAG